MCLDIFKTVRRAQLGGNDTYVGALDEGPLSGFHIRLVKQLGTDHGALLGAQGEDKALGFYGRKSAWTLDI